MSGGLSNLFPNVINTHTCFLTCPGPVNENFSKRAFPVGEGVSAENPLLPWLMEAVVATNWL